MKSRTHYSVLNSTVSFFIYLLRLIVAFFVRTFFIKYLGVEYLGLNGLFTNILSFLSLAELGIGTTIVYELYRPLAQKNNEEIRAFMRLYKKAYTIIGIVIGVVGVTIIPFLPTIVGHNDIPNVNILYVLFLTNSVASYFFTYKRSLLNADQQNFKTVINDFVFYVLLSVVQVGLLIGTKSFVLYLVVQIVSTILSNLSISFLVDRQYPFLRYGSVAKLPKSKIHSLVKNVVGNLSSQIGSIVVLGSDNILISMFVGLSAVGLYSNYTLITNAAKSLIQQVTNSVTSSIGNLLASNNRERHYEVFKTYLFINTTFDYFCCVGMFALLNPFITIWIGKEYVLPNHTVMLICIYMGLLIYQNTVRNYSSAYGLFWEQRLKPLFEAVVNLAVSVLLLKVFHMGIDGVLYGTIASTLLVDAWYEPIVVFKYGMLRSARWYFLKTGLFYIKFLIGLFSIEFISPWITVNNISSFIQGFFLYLFCVIITYLALFGFDKQMSIVAQKLMGRWVPSSRRLR